MKDKIKFWFVRNYYKLFKKQYLIQLVLGQNIFKEGDVVIASSPSNDLLYLGSGYYILNKNYKK